jgi:hypothetical protein
MDPAHRAIGNVKVREGGDTVAVVIGADGDAVRKS